MQTYVRYSIGFLLFLTFSLTVQAQDISAKRKAKTASRFEGAVNVLKSRKVLKYISEEYKTRHKDKSRSELLAQFFAGTVKGSTVFVEVPFNKIYGFRLIEVVDIHDNLSRYKFEINTPEGMILTSLYLKPNAKKTKFYFEPMRL